MTESTPPRLRSVGPEKASAPVLALVAPAAVLAPRSDVVRAVEGMLEDARAGRLVGLAGTLLYRDEHGTVLAGEAQERPIFTRGLLCWLDDELAALLR